MPVFLLSGDPVFPDPRLAEPIGILAVGGDLSPERLIAGYAAGVFPWYQEGQPLCWWSPDPRLVLEPARVHVPRSLRKVMRAARYEVRLDTAFDRVIRRCAAASRPGQHGTWITEDMIAAYAELHRRGLAHSVEAWREGALVGGLYGVSLGGAFFGESMYADRPNASKVALVALCERLHAWGFDFVDCQVTTQHLQRFGASEVPRAEFLDRLARALRQPTRRGPWVG